MTLNDIVYSEKLTYDEKHTELNRLLNQIQNQTSWRKYNFDPKYNFSQEWENLSPNAQWKEVQLGLDIVNLKKYWAKEYKYEDIHKTFNSKLFRDWFRPYINLGSIRRKNKEQGLKFYNFHKEKVSIKQAIKWINTLIDLWLRYQLNKL